MCVISIFHLGFLAVMWMFDLSLLNPFMEDPSIPDLARIGPVLYQPMDVEPSAHFMEIRQPRFLSSSVALSPHGSVIFERKDPWGDSSRFRG